MGGFLGVPQITFGYLSGEADALGLLCKGYPTAAFLFLSAMAPQFWMVIRWNPMLVRMVVSRVRAWPSSSPLSMLNCVE